MGPGGDTSTENPSGNPGEQKSTADDEDDRHGNASREGGMADDVDPSSRNPAEQKSAADADSTRGIAPTGVVEPSETDGGHPVVTAGAPTTHAVVVGPSAVAAAALGVGRSANYRRPSSTLAWLLVLQVQFLAILSLVDSVGSGNSWLPSILREMR